MNTRTLPSKRPTGRVEVTAALKAAALTLLREKGSQFSIREVAEHAGVNQGLIYRHFGSKEQLISDAVSEITAELSNQLQAGGSPVDLMITKWPETATMLARLVLDDATALITEHPVVEAMISQSRQRSSGGGPTAETRVAIASATILGWSLFNRYLTESSDNKIDPDVDAILRNLVEELLAGQWPELPPK